jgi:D-glycero-alpha-D-manno-heptose-7-phosphate kinase
MIISRTPFRISLCGGGSDLPVFYQKHSGCVLSVTINKYMYISVHPSFQRKQTILKYSKTEIVDCLDDIEHKYFRVILKELNLSGLEIASIADIPSGTGLGSSSSFTVGLVQSLYAYKNKLISKEFLANEACKIELELLKHPIGKQDQYAAAYGGFNFYIFKKNGTVSVEPMLLSFQTLEKLQRNLMLFYINGSHNASIILEEHGKKIVEGNGEEMQKNICNLTYQLRECLIHDDINAVGKILHESWMIKRSLAPGITTPDIDALYKLAIKNGATGGKILGAGGAGFLLLYVPESQQQKVRSALSVPQQEFAFEKQGSAIIYVGDEFN